MTLQEAVEILRVHNIWRRGGSNTMQDPKLIGKAIDVVVKEMAK